MCPGQLRCLGQNDFSKQKDCFLNKPLVPGSFAAWGRTCSQKTDFLLSKPLVPGSFAAWGRTCSQKTDFQEFWDPCVQNKTSEISKNALSGILGLLCAEQDVGNLKKWTFRNSGAPVRRTRRLKSQKHAVSGIQVTKTNSASWGRTFLGGMPLSADQVLSPNHPKSTPEFASGQPRAPSCSSRPDEATHFATSRFPYVSCYFFQFSKVILSSTLCFRLPWTRTWRSHSSRPPRPRKKSF